MRYLFLFLFSILMAMTLSSVNFANTDKLKVGYIGLSEYEKSQLPDSVVQLCNEDRCVFPTDDKSKTAAVKVPHVEKEFILPISGNDSGLSEYLNERISPSLLKPQDGMFVFAGSYFLIGIFMALTPCILPLIILIAGFLGQGAYSDTYRRTLLLSIVYVLGLSLTFTMTGFMAGYFGWYLHPYFQSPVVLVLFSLFLCFFAISLIGITHIQLPERLQHVVARMNRLREHYSYSQAFAMGVIATLIVSPCAAAPMIGVMGMLAATGNIFPPLLALFMMGLGVGAPLIISVLLGKRILPRDTGVQYAVRFFIGLSLFAVAIWIVSVLIPPYVSMILWGFLLIFAGVYMMNSSVATGLNLSLSALWKSFGILLLIYGGMIIVGGQMGSVSPLNPLTDRDYSYEELQFKKITSVANLRAEIKASSPVGKPSLVLFAASWCKACKKLKSNVLANPHIRFELKKFNMYEVNLSEPGSDEYKVAKYFHIIGPPEIIFFYADGKISKYRIGGVVSVSNFDNALHEILMQNVRIESR